MTMELSPIEHEGERDEAFQDSIRRISYLDDPKQLCTATYSVLEFILRRKSDKALLVTLSELIAEIISRIPFDRSPDEVQAATRQAAASCIRVLLTAKAKRTQQGSALRAHGAAIQQGAGTPAGKGDVDYYVPPHLSHLLERIEYTVPTPPPAQKGFQNFVDLCEAAILHRIDKVLVFFQRSNDNIIRELPKPFLASTAWAVKFKQAVRRFIFPSIRDSRQIRILSVAMDWSKIDTDNFWLQINNQLKDKIILEWSNSWDRLLMLKTQNENGDNVAKIKELTRNLRDELSPSKQDNYDIPKITNIDIELFKSILDASTDWCGKLTEVWAQCHDLYEQEKDPRVYQQQARDGALRDCLLSNSQALPEHWGDFLVLSCHYVFPRINTSFLERLSASMGRDEAQRTVKMPYLMRYLRQVREHPKIKIREQEEEEQWKIERQQLRTFLSGQKPLG